MPCVYSNVPKEKEPQTLTGHLGPVSVENETAALTIVPSRIYFREEPEQTGVAKTCGRGDGVWEMGARSLSLWVQLKPLPERSPAQLTTTRRFSSFLATNLKFSRNISSLQ